MANPVLCVWVHVRHMLQDAKTSFSELGGDLVLEFV